MAATMTANERELLQLFRDSNPEMKSNIIMAVCLTAKYGDQFLMDAEPAANDPAAFRAVIERYAAM